MVIERLPAGWAGLFHRSALLLAAIALALPLLAQAAQVKQPDIWFDPLTHNRDPNGKGLQYTEHDLPALMQPGAPWQKTDSHIAVLGMPANVVRSYPDLPQLVKFVAAHKWKFMLGLSVEYAGDLCPRAYEGVTRNTDYAHEAVNMVQMWKAAGGRLDYVSMDSPFHFTHYHTPKCHLEIEESAKRAATTMRMVFAEYPNVKVMTAEGPSHLANQLWLNDMATWIGVFNKETGHKIDAVALDLHWHDIRPGNSWQETTRECAAFFHKMGIATGLFINADGGKNYPMTDAEWMDLTRSHLREALASNLGEDFIDIAQWHRHVKYNLPESDPSSWTSMSALAVDLESGAAH